MGERRISFLVPRSYVLYYDQEELFGYKVPDRNKVLTRINSTEKAENESLTSVKESELTFFRGMSFPDLG